MADADIIQRMISRLGQSQDERFPPELGAHYADVDERTPPDLLRFAAAFAAHVRYWPSDGTTATGDWHTFFPQLAADPAEADRLARRLLDEGGGSTAPHLALLLAFLKLYELPRDAINRLTAAHLAFFYGRVLRIEPRGPVPDKAHVLVELKKNAPTLAFLPEHAVSAGKDAGGAELVYAPTRETVVSQAGIASLRSVFLDRRDRGTVRSAPIANSADGLGGPLTGDEPKWAAFGGEDLPAAEVGFALAAPVLRMREGARIVTVSLTVAGVDLASLDADALAHAFTVFVTGEKGWLGPYGTTVVTAAGEALTLRFTVPAAGPAVTDYDAAVHGYAYTARAPIAHFRLQASPALGYADLAGVTLHRVRASVAVTGVTSLSLESDAGTLDPRKAFLPFGPQPVVGSRFLVGCEEALAKKLSGATIRIHWQGAPASFATHYANYSRSVTDASFRVTVALRDGSGLDWVIPTQRLFASPPTAQQTLSLAPPGTSPPPAAVASEPTGADIYALTELGSVWARRFVSRRVLIRPGLAYATRVLAVPKPGFITLQLLDDFLHADFRTTSVANALEHAGTPNVPVLNEPYTPTIQAISLDYEAHSDEVNLDATSLPDFTNLDVQFFHVGCFGQMREHGYQRRQLDYVLAKSVSLLPAYDFDGELLIGVSGVMGGDSVSVLFQVAEGSADPDLEPADLEWFVLCDNYWRPLAASERLLDTTTSLLTSGVMRFVLPADATVDNTILPRGPIWLRVAVNGSVASICQLITVAANAVEVQLASAGNDPRHLALPLPKGKIAKLVSGPPTVKAVTQPFASFGGKPSESDEAFARRVAERLRHRDRAVTVWDCERLVLEAFPEVHKAKCVPHATGAAWLAPGHLLLVVVANLRNRNARDPLRPKLDARTIEQVRSYVQQRSAMQAVVHVKNPRYQSIQLDFAARFRPGLEFNYYSRQLQDDLVRCLSPWAYAGGPDIAFGGRIYKSVLLAFVEGREYVDYVTDFRMYSGTGQAGGVDLNEAAPETPDTILVSAAAHVVRAA